MSTTLDGQAPTGKFQFPGEYSMTLSPPVAVRASVDKSDLGFAIDLRSRADRNHAVGPADQLPGQRLWQLASWVADDY
jgi:hypothetical protein